MNDRYLYRAKRMDNGEWIVGILIIFEEIAYIMEDENTYIRAYYDGGDCVDFDMRAYKVDPSTICQCTGRNDEWEHDIFQCDDDRYEIKFCEYSLTWEAVSVFSSESIGLGEFSQSEYVRLGNSIDNPELLEV